METENPTPAPKRPKRPRRWLRILVRVGLLIVLWVGFFVGRIVYFGGQDRAKKADAIVVLGAAVYHRRPSPAFAARLQHAIELWKKGVAPKIVFTGGLGHGGVICESEVGRQVAMEAGVPASAILIERVSRFTWENLTEAQKVMHAHGLTSAVIVSDPDHLLRASMMATDLGLAHTTSPTPSTVFRTWRTRVPFVLSELWLCHSHRIGHWLGWGTAPGR